MPVGRPAARTRGHHLEVGKGEMNYGTSALKPYADGLTPDQQTAADTIISWRENWPGSNQTFVLGAYQFASLSEVKP